MLDSSDSHLLSSTLLSTLPRSLHSSTLPYQFCLFLVHFGRSPRVSSFRSSSLLRRFDRAGRIPRSVRPVQSVELRSFQPNVSHNITHRTYYTPCESGMSSRGNAYPLDHGPPSRHNMQPPPTLRGKSPHWVSPVGIPANGCSSTIAGQHEDLVEF